jgi:hypothetical protein
LTTLNGCAQGLAFLGPVLSYSKTGSVMQSALSYGTNVAYKKVRAKSSTENMENAFDENKTINNSDFFKSAKNKIDNSSSITNLANQ